MNYNFRPGVIDLEDRIVPTVLLPDASTVVEVGAIDTASASKQMEVIMNLEDSAPQQPIEIKANPDSLDDAFASFGSGEEGMFTEEAPTSMNEGSVDDAFDGGFPDELMMSYGQEEQYRTHERSTGQEIAKRNAAHYSQTMQNQQLSIAEIVGAPTPSIIQRMDPISFPSSPRRWQEAGGGSALIQPDAATSESQKLPESEEGQQPTDNSHQRPSEERGESNEAIQEKSDDSQEDTQQPHVLGQWFEKAKRFAQQYFLAN